MPVYKRTAEVSFDLAIDTLLAVLFKISYAHLANSVCSLASTFRPTFTGKHRRTSLDIFQQA